MLRLIKQAFFDAKGRPIISPERGIAAQTARYDAKGQQVESSSFDVSGKPVESLDGYPHSSATYDRTGKPISREYFDEFGVLVLRRMPGDVGIPSEASIRSLQSLRKKAIPVIAELDAGPESIAKKVRLHVGDVLMDYAGVICDGQTPQSVVEWMKAFDAGPDRMRILGILRDGKRLEIPVPKGKLGVRVEYANLTQ